MHAFTGSAMTGACCSTHAFHHLGNGANKGLIPVSPPMAGIKVARLPGHVPEQMGLECDVVVPHLLLPVNHCYLVLFAQEGVYYCDDSLCLWL